VKTKLLLAVSAALIAWGLKRHYSEARADDLWWILAPTAWVTGTITDTAFVMQSGEGYFARERLFLIEKSCAGVNFLIAAFGMLIFARIARVASSASAVRVLAASLLAGYSAAVIVNSVRISIAMWLAGHPIPRSVLSANEVHRVEGIVVYFGGLVLLYEIVQRLDRRAVVVRTS
jgi:exosortase K